MAEPFIGQVDLFGFTFAPEHWSRCEGQSLRITDNQALFSLLGNAYGGDGRTTFALPDLRGKAAASFGVPPGSPVEWKMGQKWGTETQTLTTQQLPSHSHLASFSCTSVSANVSLSATTEEGDSATPSEGAYLAQTKAPQGGRDKPELIYQSSPTSGTSVELGGVEVYGPVVPKGNVTLSNTGDSQPFSILQAGLVVNYSIALQGLFPSRS